MQKLKGDLIMVGFLNFSKKHAVCHSTLLKATNCGKIYNILKDSTGFSGTIVDVAANGNFYVEVTDPGDAVLLIQVPLIYEEYTTAMQHESNFYNANGDIVRAYELYKGDVFELSKEGFEGTPQKGKSVTINAKKVKVAD